MFTERVAASMRAARRLIRGIGIAPLVPATFVRPRLLIATAVLVNVTAGAASGQVRRDPLYRDAGQPVAARVRDLLGRMTLDEKFWQMFMIPGSLDDASHDFASGVFGLQVFSLTGSGEASPDLDAGSRARLHTIRINEIQRYFVEGTRLGIPIIPFDEALHGLVRDGATVFPQAIGLAATWDTALVARVAAAVARETRSRGIRQVLSPVVNIANDVRWGRVEETYGEDPYLASAMAMAFVHAFESNGVIATPKHFVANVGDGGRDSYPIDYDARLLEELFFPPFRAALRAGARSVMSAYNSVDGTPATQSRWLLTDVLTRDWGFDGFVISDAAATGGATVLHMTEANTASAAKHAVEAGLDVIFQSSWEQHRPWLDAFRRHLIADSAIDRAVARILRAKFELGLFEHPFADPDSAAWWNGNPDHRRLSREAARASIVLLRNEHAALPLRKTLRTVAMIGTDAVEARLGGYSGPGSGAVSILDGVRDALGPGADVRYSPGPGRTSPEYVAVPREMLVPVSGDTTIAGLSGEYFDNNRLEGTPRLTRTDANIDFRWTLNSPARGIPFDWYSVRWTGRLRVPAEGLGQIGIEGNDGYRLWLDGALLIDNWVKQSYGSRVADVDFEPASVHDLRIEYFESTGNARVRLIRDNPAGRQWQRTIDAAAGVARSADVAIVVAGIEEGEFRDRARLSLPGHQEAMIRAVAETGTPVIVVLVGGSVITVERWMDDAAAIVHAWYPGEEGGRAVADVLFGDFDPAGRLPITWPVEEGQLPLVYNHKPTGRGDDYVDLTGNPRFPFGFGLSYTTFEYSDLQVIGPAAGESAAAVVRFSVTNTGRRAGDEVAQLYVRDILASVARPVMELKRFQRMHLEPGETAAVEFRLPVSELRFLDRDLKWTIEPGAYRVMVGASSRDIRLRGEFSTY